jgi:hypothetical protein
MLEQIGSGIVMFLLGSALTYFTTRWSKTLKKIDRLEFGVQALLRDRMLQMFSYYKEKGKKVPLRERESFENMYSAYTENEGNSFMPDVREEFLELPHETR